MMKEYDEEYWEITCPYCMDITLIPDGDSANLKKNFSVMEIVRSKMRLCKVQEEPPAVVPDSDPLNPILPEKCAEDYAHLAVHYCSSCQMNFCETCWRRAHRMQSFSSHEQTPIAEKPPICAGHPTQVTDLICLVCIIAPYQLINSFRQQSAMSPLDLSASFVTWIRDTSGTESRSSQRNISSSVNHWNAR